MIKHLIVIDIVGLEEKHLTNNSLPNISALIENGESSKMKPVFPAVTCPVQTSFLTGEYPTKHGIISNGYLDRNTYTVSFWDQYSFLVQVPRIWDLVKSSNPDLKTAILFWQNSLYSNSDIILTPKPLHMEKEMIQWCYSKPVGYYEEIKEQIGEFDLSTYWGPFASRVSSQWITTATQYTIEKHKPNLLYTYIPHVDYSAQRFGKDSSEVSDDLIVADNIIERIVQSTKRSQIYADTQFVIFSEYSFNNVADAIHINLIFRDNGLLSIRKIKDKEYVDFELSRAFAVVDHQIANVYIKFAIDLKVVTKLLQSISGIDTIISNNSDKKIFNIDNERTGDIIVISKRDRWFSYYWWHDVELAPDFTKTVDIHRKPGYDPLELFIDTNTKSISHEPRLIKSSHGRPTDSDTGEGYSFYGSNIKSDLQKDSSNALDVVNIGKYLITQL